ncbi:helix-turn-helix domain-containing protein [Streptomyces sp. NBC_01614]|uniref:helix-turn-helix domain-containing protein n=2 Tax=Streptomyces sp. NBC_01614 TaxID=2975897 RepID=UPI00386FA961
MFRPVWRFAHGSCCIRRRAAAQEHRRARRGGAADGGSLEGRYAERGMAGLEEQRRGGPRTQVPQQVRARVIALTRMSPPAESGLSHWSTRTLADHLKRREGVSVSCHYIARIWREENLKPHRSGAFKISKDRSTPPPPSPRRSRHSTSCEPTTARTTPA